VSICPGNWHFSPCPSIYRQVAEGYATTFSLVELIEKTNRPHRRERTFPIIYTVYSILNGTSSPQEGVKCVLRAVGGLNCVSYGMDCSLTLAYIQSITQAPHEHAGPRGALEHLSQRLVSGRNHDSRTGGQIG